MNTAQLIAAIDEQIERLTKARNLLNGDATNLNHHKHQMTPEGRRRIALAMKRRWAAAKKAGKTRLG